MWRSFFCVCTVFCKKKQKFTHHQSVEICLSINPHTKKLKLLLPILPFISNSAEIPAELGFGVRVLGLPWGRCSPPALEGGPVALGGGGGCVDEQWEGPARAG